MAVNCQVIELYQPTVAASSDLLEILKSARDEILSVLSGDHSDYNESSRCVDNDVSGEKEETRERERERERERGGGARSASHLEAL